MELFYLTHRPLNTPCTVLSISNLSRILVIVTLLVVVYKIQPSNVFELQQHSPLFSYTSVTTYAHRMIISPPCLFKHTKNDEHVARLFQCLLDHTHQNLYLCLISFLINNVSKSVYINFRTIYIRNKTFQKLRKSKVKYITTRFMTETTWYLICYRSLES